MASRLGKSLRLAKSAARAATKRPAKLATPRRSVPTEHEEQTALITRLRLALPELESMLTAVPNGGDRNVLVAAKLRKEGVKKGYPDLLIDLPRGPYHGARIEMKRVNAPPSAVKADQAEWIEALAAVGYFALVCRGQDEAFAALHWYWLLGTYDPQARADWLSQ